MKRTLSFVLTFVWTCATLLTLTATAPAADWFYVSRYPAIETTCDVSGSIVVWAKERRTSSGDPCDVHARDLAAGRWYTVCDRPGIQCAPSVSGRTVVWLDYGSDANGDIRGRTLPSGSIFTVCGDRSIQGSPDISGRTVVWVDYRNAGVADIYGRIIGGSTFPVCTAWGDQEEPGISGDVVVWTDRRNGYDQADIRGKNLVTGEEFVVCDAPGVQQAPAISGRLVCWVDYRGGQDVGTIYARNLDTGQEVVVSDGGDCFGPSVAGDVVSWQSHPGQLSPGVVKVKNMDSGQLMTYETEGEGDLLPAVSGRLVVWERVAENAVGLYITDLCGAYLPWANQWPYARMKQGDIILERNEGRIADLFEDLYQAWWTHAYVYVGYERGHQVIEAMGPGRKSRKISLEERLKNYPMSERWAILHVRVSAAKAARTATYAESHLVGKPYRPNADTITAFLLDATPLKLASGAAVTKALWRNDPSACYCSSLVWKAWKRGADINIDSEMVEPALPWESWSAAAFPFFAALPKSWYCVPDEIWSMQAKNPSLITLVAAYPD